VTLVAPLGFSGSIVVTAQSGAASAQTAVVVNCTAFPALLSINLGSGTVACGTSVPISVSVTNGLGQPVANGTFVLFSTTAGTITQVTTTVAGLAGATFSAPAGTAGTAIIQATAGGVTRQAVMTLTCVAPTLVPPTQAPISQVAAQSTLPRAGFGPDPARNNGVLYAGMALVAAGVLVLGTSFRRRDLVADKATLPLTAHGRGPVTTSGFPYAGATLLAGGILIVGAWLAARRGR